MLPSLPFFGRPSFSDYTPLLLCPAGHTFPFPGSFVLYVPRFMIRFSLISPLLGPLLFSSEDHFFSFALFSFLLAKRVFM